MKAISHILLRPAPVSMLWVLSFFAPGISTSRAAGEWEDVSTPLLDKLAKEGAKTEWPGGCSGVAVNRLNGEVTVKVVGLGLWRSADQGQTWTRIDDKSVGGRDETGWATSTDQKQPARMASFSLDGPAGWSAGGTKWQSFAGMGRNWDYGSVDWSVDSPRWIIAAKHETTPPGEVYVSGDGGAAWRLLSIHLQEKRDLVSMVGSLGDGIFIYSNGAGIHRSTDGGLTWMMVSELNPQTRIPVLMDGVHYLGTSAGLLVSKDRGAAWREQGAPVNVWQGPFFGAGPKEMLVAGKDGLFLTEDAGVTWRKAANLKPDAKGFSFSPKWFGCYAWDPVHDVVYVSSMGNPVFRMRLDRHATR